MGALWTPRAIKMIDEYISITAGACSRERFLNFLKDKLQMDGKLKKVGFGSDVLLKKYSELDRCKIIVSFGRLIYSHVSPGRHRVSFLQLEHFMQNILQLQIKQLRHL
jgi:hypothetical protein